MRKDIRYNGQTAVPSDYDSPDGDLAISLGIIKDHGALRPIPRPTEVSPAQDRPQNLIGKVVHIHKTTKYTHKIMYYPATGGQLMWADSLEAQEGTFRSIYQFSNTPVKKVTSSGNTLMALTDAGVFYFLWKEDDGAYVAQGNGLPEVSISFGLQSELEMSDLHQFYVSDPIQAADFQRAEGQPVDLSETNKATFTSAVMAEVNKFIADKATNAGKFIMPFFVRYALRLFDGTLVHHSAPVFMPCASDVTPAARVNYGGGSYGDFTVQVLGAAHSLDYQVSMDMGMFNKLMDWKDVIVSVDVFVSAPLYKYDQAGEIKQIGPCPRGLWSLSKQIDQQPSEYPQRYQVNTLQTMFYKKTGNPILGIWETYAMLPSKSDDEFADSIRSCSTFYLLKSIPLEELSQQRVKFDIPHDYLQSLVTREAMTDDYDSHDGLIAGTSFVYNQRINLADLTKSLFQGFDAFSALAYSDGYVNSSEFDRHPDTNDTAYDVSFYVYVKKDGKTIILKDSMSVEGIIAYGVPFLYFYYPSTAAYKVVVKRGESCWEFPLKPHDFLNGAVYVGDFSEGWPQSAILQDTPTPSENRIVDIKNKLYTSEVGNPYFFPLLGISTVGTGRILGLSTAAKALSEGQFGHFPLYAFSEDGVWAMEVSPTGTFSAKQPITRDVVLGPDSITQLDNAVLFVTDRGIMILSGSNSACISEMIDDDGDLFNIRSMPSINEIMSLAGGGLSNIISLVHFKDYIQGCSMIYSYVRQQVFVFNPDYAYAYVYSLSDRTWAMAPSDIYSRIESYPEALAMTKAGAIVDYAGEGEPYPQLIVTRPLKLDAPDILKTMSAAIQRGHFLKGHLSSILLGSRDLESWFIVKTSNDARLTNFFGTPYRYFRLILIGRMGRRESLSSVSTEYELRLTDRMR